MARRVIEQKAPVWDREQDVVRTVAIPAMRADRVLGAVVLTFSVNSVVELHRSGRLVVLWFVPAAIVVLTLMVDLLIRRFIHKPIAGDARDDAARAGRRPAPARRSMRGDEIGAVAEGLNEMLAQMENFNAALQTRGRTRRPRNCAPERGAGRELPAGVRPARGACARRADGGGRADGGHRGAPDRHAAQSDLGLRPDADRGSRADGAGRDAGSQIVQEQIAKVTAIVRTMLDHARRPSPRSRSSLGEIVEARLPTWRAPSWRPPA